LSTRTLNDKKGKESKREIEIERETEKQIKRKERNR
jgi:hypothetical protein